FNLPDGRSINYSTSCPSGLEEQMTSSNSIILADGGWVLFQPEPWLSCYVDPSNPNTTICQESTYFLPAAVIDPYGQSAAISYAVAGQDQYGNTIYRINQIKEAGGRFLQFYYRATYPNRGYTEISRVEANDGQGSTGNVTQWVN